MSYQSELYQRVILDHNKRPRNFRKIDSPTHFCNGINPLCGDEIDLYLKVNQENLIEEISFQGKGCAISTASASLLSVNAKGKSSRDVKKLFDEFHRMVLGILDPNTEENHLGKLSIFLGIREYPARVKCATLVWHALICALEKRQETSTE